MVNSKGRMLWILIIVVLVFGIYFFYYASFGNKTPLKLTAWLADWDYEVGLRDLRKIYESLAEVQIFAAYFDHEDRIYFTENYHKLINELNNLDYAGDRPKFYLTIVNDSFDVDGNPTQKDPLLLLRILNSEESRQKHIDEIISIVSEGGFNGIEIDYEKVPPSMWLNYVDFCEKLYQRTLERDLFLRIVLEPNNEFDKSILPKGPQYVVMVYNMFGPHSGPGPKTDYKFINRVASRFSSLLDGSCSLAFASGGFDWSANGIVISLNEQQAKEIAKKYQSKISRDKASGVVWFDYRDENNIDHQVWYADEDTLSKWFNYAKKKGYYQIALWRLGGSSQQTIKKIVMDGF